jgi:hypothetical protein
VRGNPIDRVDPTGQSASTNTIFLWDWLTGGGGTTPFYDSSSPQTQELQNSIGAQKLKRKFIDNKCKPVTFEYGSGEAWWDTLANPFTANVFDTAAQVGGFANATAVGSGDTVTYTIPNVAGTHSLLYHAVPDRKGRTGPMRNVMQTFQWTEPCPCK